MAVMRPIAARREWLIPMATFSRHRSAPQSGRGGGEGGWDGMTIPGIRRICFLAMWPLNSLFVASPLKRLQSSQPAFSAGSAGELAGRL